MNSISLIGFGLAFLCAISWALLDITRKKIGKEMTATGAVIGVMFLQAPFILPFMGWTEATGVQPGNVFSDIVFVGFPSWEQMTAVAPDFLASVDLTYIELALTSVILNLAANLLFLRAVQISPLSLTTPYLAFTPVFTALSVFIVYDDIPTVWGVTGILTVCIGAFFLNPGNKEEGVLAPLKALWTERGSFYMLIVAGIWSITPVIDKAASELTSPFWHTFILGFGVALFFTIWRVWDDRGVGPLWKEMTIHPWWMAAGGFFAVGAMAMQLGSYEFINPSYVETVKRAVGVTSAILAGYFIFGEEDIGRRLLGAAVMTAGVAMVLLGG